jgi:hypothetical protein
MGFTRRPRVRETLFLTPLLLFLFVWAQVVSIDNPLFLVFLSFSLFLLVSNDVSHVSKRIKQLFQAVLLVTIIVSVIGAASVAAFSRGGARHSLAIRPDDFDMTLKYGSWASGYYGRQEWTFFKADYAVGGVFADYFVDFVNIFVNRSVNLNGHIWVHLSLLPNHYMADTVFRLTEGTFVLNGTQISVSLNPDHWLTVHWGSFSSAYRVRIDRGYTVTFFITLRLEGADYGDLGVTIPLKGDTYPMFRIDDVEVSSQLQDGIAVLFSGILAGIQIQALAKPVKRFLKPKQAEEKAKPTVQTVSS